MYYFHYNSKLKNQSDIVILAYQAISISYHFYRILPISIYFFSKCSMRVISGLDDTNCFCTTLIGRDCTFPFINVSLKTMFYSVSHFRLRFNQTSDITTRYFSELLTRIDYCRILSYLLHSFFLFINFI